MYIIFLVSLNVTVSQPNFWVINYVRRGSTYVRYVIQSVRTLKLMVEKRGLFLVLIISES
jgi:hypothetical protein